MRPDPHREDQRSGWIRPDLATDDLADGLIGFVLAMVMASVQIGPTVDQTFGQGSRRSSEGSSPPDPRLG